MPLRDAVVAVDRAEDEEEDDRQEEREERGLSVSPEEQLLRRSSWRNSLTRRSAPGRRPRVSAADLELVELFAASERLGGQFVQARVGSCVRSTITSPFAAEADLRLDVAAASSAGEPSRMISPFLSTATRSASCSASSR